MKQASKEGHLITQETATTPGQEEGEQNGMRHRRSEKATTIKKLADFPVDED